MLYIHLFSLIPNSNMIIFRGEENRVINTFSHAKATGWRRQCCSSLCIPPLRNPLVIIIVAQSADCVWVTFWVTFGFLHWHTCVYYYCATIVAHSLINPKFEKYAILSLCSALEGHKTEKVLSDLFTKSTQLSSSVNFKIKSLKYKHNELWNQWRGSFTDIGSDR